MILCATPWSMLHMLILYDDIVINVKFRALKFIHSKWCVLQRQQQRYFVCKNHS